ncbi:MAG: Fe-S cluster assembly protein SufD [Bacteroidia bacterium]
MEIATIKDNTFLNDWLNQIQSKVNHIPDEVLVNALKYIEEKGIPNIKDEAYRNVPIESILKRYFRKISHTDTKETSAKEIKNPDTIILHPEKAQFYLKEKGISIYNAENIPKQFENLIGQSNTHQQDFFAALNTAYCPSINIIHITQSIQHPLYIIHTVTSSNFNQNRTLFVIDKDVQCTIVEYYEAQPQQNTFYNYTSECFISENANVKWINIQNEKSNQLYTVNNSSFILAQSARFHHHQITLNGALWRNNLQMHINDKEIDCQLKGLSIGKNQNIISQNTAILHNIGYSHSDQLYKQIADDKSTVLFNGFILVNKNAQKTNAYQNSKNLLLNDNATIFAKPQLEIYADDVRCSHGSSTGALNEDALFYLRARGIDKSSAQKLLLYAFFNDIVESFENKEIQEFILQQIEI